jgi:hypothetical protein
MWLLAFAIYCGVKGLTWFRRRERAASWWLHAGYLLAWPGLDADGFLRLPVPRPAMPSLSEWLYALGKFAIGLILVAVSARALPSDRPYLVGWVGMIGIVFTLHFGLFHLLSCSWRSAGVTAPPLMNWPIASTSLSEFWGQRWNVAFRDLTHRFLFRPLLPRLGANGALLIGFLFSGIVHDVVISLPAGGGYGGPTLFFVLQGAGLFIERSAAGRALGLGKGWRGWMFTAIILFAPACLLFHPPFVLNIVVPFLEAIAPHSQLLLH